MSLEEVLISLPVFVFALSVHEYAHAWSAVRLGDPTPKWQGRLTLDPRAHLSLLGTLMVFIARVGWAKPVPVNPRNLRNPRRDMALIALAGPLSNAAQAVAFSLLYHVAIEVLPYGSGGYWAQYFLLNAVYINSLLFVFNLLPIPPLDGSKILALLLPPRWHYQMQMYEQYGMLLLVLGFGILRMGAFIGAIALSITRLLL